MYVPFFMWHLVLVYMMLVNIAYFRIFIGAIKCHHMKMLLLWSGFEAFVVRLVRDLSSPGPGPKIFGPSKHIYSCFALLKCGID